MRNSTLLNPASQAMSGQGICAAPLLRAAEFTGERDESNDDNGSDQDGFHVSH